MNLRDNGPLREMLAAEYALGTLRGGARQRFERLARHDTGLRDLAMAWSQRLAPLLDELQPAVPPRRVWDAIEARLPGFAARREGGSTLAAGWWDRLGFWRGLSAAFATVAVVALGLAMRPGPVPETRIVQAEPKIVQAPPKIVQAEPKVVEVDRLPTAVATLTDAKSGAPVAVVFMTQGGTALIVKVATTVPVDDGKALQLWMAPDDAKSLESLGVLPAAAQGEPVRIDAVDATRLSHAKAFGLSLEPAGGSPQPTKVLGLGALVRLSS